MSQPDEKNVGAGFRPPSQARAAGSAPAQPTKPAPKLAIWIATGFGLGYLPIAPGTWGSLGGIVATYFFANSWNYCIALMEFFAESEIRILHAEFELLGFIMVSPVLLASLFGIVFLAFAGAWAARHAMGHFGKPDPGPIVVDEISGQQITYLPVLSSAFGSSGWKYLLLGFILFRVLDIVKPWPCKQAERWPHGWGIMADDWFAGLYAATILWIVQRLGWLG